MSQDDAVLPPPQPSAGQNSPSAGHNSSSSGPASPSGGPASPSGGPASPSGGPASPSGGPNAPPIENRFDPAVLKSAYNAFKKRWKITRLDQESQIGRGPMSSGQRSTITGITPPDQFPRAVWDELVNQGKLKRAGTGMYAMP